MRECSRSDGTGVSLVGNPRRRGEKQRSPSMSCSLSKLPGLVEWRRDGPSARRNFQSCGGTNWCVNKVMAVPAKSPCAPVQSPRVNLDTMSSSRERVNGLNRRRGRLTRKTRFAGEGRRGPSLRASSASQLRPVPLASLPVRWRGRTTEFPPAVEKVGMCHPRRVRESSFAGAGARRTRSSRAGCVSTQRLPHWRVAPLGSRNE